MESLELVSKEYIEDREYLGKVGYEVLGLKYDSKGNIYMVRKKDKS